MPMTGSENFRELAISVGDYVASKAEPTEAGIRWSTLSYFGKPEYSPEVFSGVAGIVLFLTDLGRITGDQTYLDLARGGARWIDETMQANHGGIGPYKGFYSGFSGHGLAMLHAGQAAGDDNLVARALARADALSQATYGGLELMWGAAGAGIFLLRCFQETARPRCLDEAVRAGTLSSRQGRSPRRPAQVADKDRQNRDLPDRHAPRSPEHRLPPSRAISIYQRRTLP